MTIRLLCQACGSKLKLPDFAAGRKGQCPQCGSVFAVSAAAAAPRRGAHRRRVKHAPIVEIDHSAELAALGQSGKPASRRPDSAVEICEEESVIELDVAEAPQSPSTTEGGPSTPARPKKPKKKKKKKRLRDRQPVEWPAWVWWAAGVGGAVALSLIVAIVAIATGHTLELLGYGIMMLIMLPVSTIILIVSMVISSHMAGGIDFGEVHTAIAKAFMLLFAVNFVGMVPFGMFLALPIWIFGLMYLFNLDFWETRFLLFINWILNFAAKYAMIAMVFAALHQAASGVNMDHDGDFEGPGLHQGLDLQMMPKHLPFPKIPGPNDDGKMPTDNDDD
jgi:hypothetical protein